jgi:hypothetical protein
VQLPKAEKAGIYETDKLLETLAENPKSEIEVGKKKYQILVKNGVEHIQRQKLAITYPQKLNEAGVMVDDKTKEGTLGYEWDESNLIPLRNKNNKLNYKYFRSLTEDIQRK